MRFSVIMPVYNGAGFVENAIHSVQAQTVKDWELIVVNDGSQDNTAKVLEGFREDPRIRVITQENGGVSAARNAALREAKGDYFAFLDADDLWHVHHLETLSEMIDMYPDAGLYATYAESLLPNGERLTGCEFTKNMKTDIVCLEDFFSEYDKDRSAKMYANSSSCVARAASEKAGGFRVGCKIGEDLAYAFCIALYGKVVFSKRITAVYDKTQSTATKDVSFDPDWYFFDEIDKYLMDDTIPVSKRASFRRVMQWFRMRRVRHYLIDGRRKEAKKAYKTIGYNKSLWKDKCITLALFLLPSRVVKEIFLQRWRSIA